MTDLLKNNLDGLAAICRRHRVKRLAVFGSASHGSFVPGTSDVDLLVDFLPMPPAQRAECYFGLIENLERLLEAEIDLVEAEAITNPFFLQSVQETQELLYAAA